MASHGRYTILGKLADGGMAEIFLASQHGAEGFERPIVLKRILTQFSADPQFRNMLLDEAHISMSLQHSNIAQVLDLGMSGGRYFLALELVDGWDLERVLQRANAVGMVWPAALALYVTACVCRALAYAHAKTRDGKPLGIVHRDISPNNVLISDQGEVKLTDFGIAKAQRKREQTAAGVIKGKVAYMSPEQAIGGVIDKRSDIFSVGSMLYRLLSGRLPFEADNDMESLLKVQKADFEPPEKVKPTVGPAVSAIIMRAMRLAPSERYQTADEMLADVERSLRTDFHSAGQTELKLWLEQLARRDNAPSIGKQKLMDTSGVIRDAVDTDLSAGTSFELDDLEQVLVSADIELASTSAATMTPPPLPQPLGGATGRVPSGAHRKLGRRRSGFWFGVGFALLAVVGLRYLIAWADGKGYLARFGIGGGAVENRAAPTVGPTAAQGPPAAGPAPAPTPAPPTTAPVTDAALAGPAPGAAPTKPPVAEGTTADAGGKAPVVDDKGSEPSADKDAVKDKEGADKDKGKEGDKVAAKDDEEEPDEEALLRDAVPNAENAVIGEDEAEEVPARPPGRAGAKPPAPAKRPASTSRPAKVQTAILHITSAPKGAIVKTKARVLGRTPINLHFKTGNTYELVFVKRGYHPTTRKVAVEGTKDRKVAVTLKKRPPPKPAKKTSFFHPHR
jgi:serine/threonine-protein kinase